jgi:hypothetical protein
MLRGLFLHNAFSPVDVAGLNFGSKYQVDENETPVTADMERKRKWRRNKKDDVDQIH